MLLLTCYQLDSRYLLLPAMGLKKEPVGPKAEGRKRAREVLFESGGVREVGKWAMGARGL